MVSLVVGDSKLGKSVFANNNFKKGEEIIEFTGKSFTRKQLPAPYNMDNDYYVQVGKNKYLGPSGSFDDFINHSCNPNSGLIFKNNKIILTAIKNIKKGNEIMWDYSTTIDEDDWKMSCLCGSKLCRKKIRDFKYLPKKIKKKYIGLGIVPDFILKEITKRE